nr:BamA/TamA family outer membrane protein [Bradyrhizobium liaoningense]
MRTAPAAPSTRCRSRRRGRRAGSQGESPAGRRKAWELQGKQSGVGCSTSPRIAAPLCPRHARIVAATVRGALVDRHRPDLASPFGPLRFDYAVPLNKGKYDVVQEFRFGDGTSFWRDAACRRRGAPFRRAFVNMRDEVPDQAERVALGGLDEITLKLLRNRFAALMRICRSDDCLSGPRPWTATCRCPIKRTGTAGHCGLRADFHRKANRDDAGRRLRTETRAIPAVGRGATFADHAIAAQHRARSHRNPE